MEGPSRFPAEIFDVSFVDWDNEETELVVAGTAKGVAKDNEQTRVPQHGPAACVPPLRWQ